VGEEGVGSCSLDATHPVGCVLVKRWKSAFSYSCLTCRGNKGDCAHTKNARAVVSLDGAPSTLSPAISSPIPKPETRNPEPDTLHLNPKPLTLNPIP